MIDNESLSAEKSTNKCDESEGVFCQVLSNKLKPNNATYNLVSTSTATSQKQDYLSSIIACNYHNKYYNYQQFEQVFLKNTFNELLLKYNKADVKKIFEQEIKSSIQHVVSKVKELTVFTYAEDQQIRVEDVASDCEKSKK